MTPDLLDDLLDHSAPPARQVPDAALTAMIADARAEVPRRRSRPRLVALTGGALALVLAGGAGVAAATDGFSWAPWAQDPVGAVAFAMDNGFSCELRFTEYTGGGDPAFLTGVNQTLEDWYRTTDVVAAIQPILPSVREHLAALRAESEMEPDPEFEALPSDEQAEELEHRAWSAEWAAWEWAVGDLETQALRDAGYSMPDERFAGSKRASQIQCFDETGSLYRPGDDS